MTPAQIIPYENSTDAIVCVDIKTDEIVVDAPAANEPARRVQGCRYIELCEWSRS